MWLSYIIYFWNNTFFLNGIGYDHSLQTHHVYSTLKRCWNERFQVVSTWDTRGVFVGLPLAFLTVFVLWILDFLLLITKIIKLNSLLTNLGKGFDIFVSRIFLPNVNCWSFNYLLALWNDNEKCPLFLFTIRNPRGRHWTNY